MKLNTQILVTGLGCDSATAAAWLDAMQAACDNFQINTPRRVAAFLANVGVESGGLRVFEENLNYSAARLAAVWPQRYAANPHSDLKAPNETALRIGSNPQAIANNVYADRLGNGHEMTGDGWAYRGAGPIQLTGKDVQVAFMKAVEFDPAKDGNLIAALHQPVLGSLSAAWFVSTYKDLNSLADSDMFSQYVKGVNGALPCDANNGPKRIAAYKACVAACNEVAGAEPVAKPPASTAKKLPPAKTS